MYNTLYRITVHMEIVFIEIVLTLIASYECANVNLFTTRKKTFFLFAARV